MSYQVLARKWRPSQFSEVVGQQHVLQALINSLDQQRLHHAYLFSGTRGVGKTSIARLLAKSLNCEVAVSATPCGTCQSCQEIEQGRFIDLLEIDAASRTKVEDTRDILDNVQYKPTRARYKVYLIDEVHMLSRSSFNALLKTLEEPPAHVKFLFATTEPKKLPVTILSRCLQFNLKALTPPQISGQLAHILTQEQIGTDDGSLSLLSQSAKGSMRDALSLTDQAISHGNGQLSTSVVAQMLGTIDVDHSIDLLAFALTANTADLFQLSDSVAQLAPDYDKLLAQMIEHTHFAAMAQKTPASVRLAKQPKKLMALAEHDAELLQLFYSILIQGRQELPWASDEKTGFDMVLLRLLAFLPAQPSIEIDSTTASPAVAAPLKELASSPEDNAIVESLNSEQASILEHASQQRAVVANAEQTHVPEPLSSDRELELAKVQSVPIASLDHNEDKPVSTHRADNQSTVAAAQFSEDELLNMSLAMSQEDDVADIDVSAVHDIALAPTLANNGGGKGDINAFLKAKNALKNQRNNTVDASVKKPRAIVDSTAEQPINQLSPTPQHHDPLDNQLASLPIVDEQSLVKSTQQIPNDNCLTQHNAVALLDDPALLLAPNSDDPWTLMIEEMGLGGRLRQLAIHSRYQQSDAQITLLLSSEHRHLNTQTALAALQKQLSLAQQSPVELCINVGDNEVQTPYQIAQQLHQQRLALAVERIKEDEAINQFVKLFDANLMIDSIKYRTIKAIS